MSEYLQVVTTTNSRAEADKISQVVVGKRLAGCAQVLGPIVSYYWWNGKIERSEEWMCLMKSKVAVYQKLESQILELHSYTVPEIIAIPITKGNERYLNWLDNVLTK